MTEFRVGQGLDVHAYAERADRRLVLGGVRIPGEPGLAGHSDADVVLHALVDALLGATGGGDLGLLFGSSEPEYADADSQVFLAGALGHLAEGAWRVNNVDLTIVGERPRIGPYRTAIAGSVAGLLGVDRTLVNVKATSTDRLGFLGRAEGLACLAVVLVQRDVG